ncbi:MAG: 50S ribosomal protein L13 [bacterium]|nr:50S ribosomal protein L13 [bacterium]
MNKIHTIDASGKPLGRLASQIALLLRGKQEASFLPYKESGNVVIVKNADKILITGKKKDQKTYFSHSGYPGGEKHTSLKKVFETRPEDVLQRAVIGMLPGNKLSQKIIKNLKFEK